MIQAVTFGGMGEQVPMGAKIDLCVESSLVAGGLTVRLANFAISGSEPVFRDLPDYYLTHMLSPQPASNADIISEPSLAAKPLRSGIFRFMPAHRPIEYRPTVAVGRVAQCVFEPRLFEDLTGPAGGWTHCELHALMDVRNPQIRDQMLRVEAEVMRPSFGSLILVEALGRVIMVEIARHFRSKSVEQKAAGQMHRWQVDRIAEFIDANCGDGSMPSTADIATLCNISTGHLKRSFKRTTGETLFRFVERVRIEKAARLLATSDITLKVVAAKSGFSTPSRLSEAFRRHTGEPPSTYRHHVRSTHAQGNHTSPTPRIWPVGTV